MIKEQLHQVQEKVKAACIRAGRDPGHPSDGGESGGAGDGCAAESD